MTLVPPAHLERARSRYKQEFLDIGMCLFLDFLDIENIPKDKMNIGFLYNRKEMALLDLQIAINTAIIQGPLMKPGDYNPDLILLQALMVYHEAARKTFEWRKQNWSGWRHFEIVDETWLSSVCDELREKAQDFNIMNIYKMRLYRKEEISSRTSPTNTSGFVEDDDDDDWGAGDNSTSSSDGNDQYSQAELDNHANQCNPNNDAYHSSRG